MTSSLHWQGAIAHCTEQGCGYVMATVISTQGSTPRDGGSKMVVTEQAVFDTLGGGRLEYLIVQQARELLRENRPCQRIRPFPLAAEAGQCCGGNVTVMLECFPECDWPLVLFGAGHVSRALTQILGGLPCRFEVIDNRRDWVEQALPANGSSRYAADPETVVPTLPENAWVVIFTHDHALDFALCDQLLRRETLPYIGLIGSRTKALRFRKRLRQAGHPQATVDRLHSPIGLSGVSGKRPMEVAVAIAAQLQHLYYRNRPATASTSTGWREIKALLRGESAPDSDTDREVHS